MYGFTSRFWGIRRKADAGWVGRALGMRCLVVGGLVIVRFALRRNVKNIIHPHSTKYHTSKPAAKIMIIITECTIQKVTLVLALKVSLGFCLEK